MYVIHVFVELSQKNRENCNICVKSASTLPAPRPRPQLSTALTSAPAARSCSTVAWWPSLAAKCNGVEPRAGEGKTCFAARQDVGSWWRKGWGCPSNLNDEDWHSMVPHTLEDWSCSPNNVIFPQKSSYYCISIFGRVHDGCVHVKQVSVPQYFSKYDFYLPFPTTSDHNFNEFKQMLTVNPQKW